MSDKPPPTGRRPSNPAVPVAPRTSSGQGTPTARRPSSKEMRAVSASRSSPRPAPVPAKLSQRLLAQATNHGLNLWGFLRDVYDGFKRSNVYFKYRVLVVVTWGVLSVTGMGIACPSDFGDSNALGARLVVTWVADEPVYMVVNDSTDSWDDVRLVVNDQYSAAATRIPPGKELTIGAKKLIDESGRPAPANLQVTKLVLKASDEKVDLVREGKLVRDGKPAVPPRP